MAMTVRDLIEVLECFDDDMEVRIAEQPNYPFEYSIVGAVEFENYNEENCLYLCEGRQIDYLSSEIWDMI